MINAPERVNIKNLAIPEPLAKRRSGLFNPQEDIPSEAWGMMKDTLIGNDEAEKALKAAACIKLLHPDFVKDIDFTPDQWNIFHWSLEDCEDSVSFMNLFKYLQVLYPQNVPLVFSNNDIDIEINIEKIKEDILADRDNDESDFVTHASSFKICFPDESLTISQWHIERAKKNLEELLNFISNTENIGHFDFLREIIETGASLRILTGEASIPEEKWEMLRTQLVEVLQKCPLEVFSEFAVNMAIAGADKLKLDQNGLELTFKSPRPEFKVHAQFPQVRKF